MGTRRYVSDTLAATGVVVYCGYSDYSDYSDYSGYSDYLF